MIVNGKLVSYDLSRFTHCSIKKAAICDLMRIPAFVKALQAEKEFDISDDWIANIAFRLVNSLRIAPGEKAALTEEEIRLRRSWQHCATNAYKLALKRKHENEIV